MRLQKNTRLALYSVLEFAADPTRHIAAAEIAERYDVSAHHLSKVLSELARAGIVESARGVGGGYRFAANARRLTLMDVIQLFEDLGAAEPEAKSTFATITLATMLRLIERQAATPAGGGAGGGVSRARARRARAGRAA